MSIQTSDGELFLQRLQIGIETQAWSSLLDTLSLGDASGLSVGANPLAGLYDGTGLLNFETLDVSQINDPVGNAIVNVNNSGSFGNILLNVDGTASFTAGSTGINSSGQFFGDASMLTVSGIELQNLQDLYPVLGLQSGTVDSDNGVALGLFSIANIGGGAIGYYAQATGDPILSYGGFAGGNQATTTGGGAIGDTAVSNSNGGAAGAFATTQSGGSVGFSTSSQDGFAGGASSTESGGGGAIGFAAQNIGGGGSVGNSAMSTTGFAGGLGAIETGGGIELGTGTYDGTGLALFGVELANNLSQITAPSVGVADASDAAIGIVGEYMASAVVSASAVPLTTNVPTDVTFILLSPGDWDVVAEPDFKLTGATSSRYQAGISLVSATLPTPPGGYMELPFLTSVSSQNLTFSGLCPIRVSVSSPQYVYLVMKVAFTGGAVGGYGLLSARRVR